MRILTIIQEYPPHRRIGSELYDHDLHQHLQKQGHTVEVIAANRREEQWEYEGIQVNPTGLKTPDLILTHIDFRQKAHYYRRLNGWTRMPLIGIAHNDQNQTLNAAKLFHWEGLIANSHYLHSLLENNCPKEILIPPTPKPATKPTIGEGILFIGSTKEKGVEVFHEIVKALPHHSFTCVFGGWGAIKEKEAPNLKNLPHQKNLPPIYKQNKILLLPSRFESWGMVASEAMAYGLIPIYYEDLIGVEENVGPAGISIPRNATTTAWVEAINQAENSKLQLQQSRHNYRLHQEQLKNIETFLTNLQK